MSKLRSNRKKENSIESDTSDNIELFAKRAAESPLASKHKKKHPDTQTTMVTREMKNEISKVVTDTIAIAMEHATRNIKEAFDSRFTDLTTSLKTFETSLAPIKLDMKEMRDKIVNIEKSQDFISKYYEEFRANLELLETKTNAIVDTNTRLIQSKNKLENAYKQHDIDIQSLKQMQINNNILLSNILVKTDENLPDLFKKICKIINIRDCLPVTIHRFTPKNKDFVPPVIVCFTNEDAKRTFLTAFKSSKVLITTQTLGLDDRSVNIYVNHHLTQYFRQLLKEARKFRHDNNFEFVWYNNCNIYLKKTKTSEAIRIQTSSGLHELSRKLARIIGTPPKQGSTGTKPKQPFVN